MLIHDISMFPGPAQAVVAKRPRSLSFAARAKHFGNVSRLEL
jgi:hypothetical protein